MEKSSSATSNARGYFNKLKHPSQFSGVQLALFVIAFGLIGYLIYHSFAAAPLVASVEAENMLPQVSNTSTSSVNLSLNKPATASSTQTLSNGTVLKPSNAVDGNSSTRWSSNYSDPQWLQIDLGSTQTFNKVVLQWETAYGKSFQIQTSDDGSSWTTVYSTASGTGGTQTLNVSGSGRYVRMYGTVRGTKYGYSLYEMQVWGQSTSSVNLSLNKPATASSTQTLSNGTVLKPSNAVDGNSSTRWSSNYSDPQWLQIDLGSTQTFNKVVLQWETAYGKSFQIQTSDDGSSWTTVYSTASGTGGTQTLNVSGSGRYVRMYGTVRGTKYGYSLYEMQVWGDTSSSGSFTQVVSDTAASNGEEMELTNNGAINGTFNLPSTANSVTVVAKSDLCSGVGGAMTVSVDGSQLISTTVNATSLTSYNNTTTNLATGSHTLSISYTNDSSTSTCDRNLYVDVIDFYGPVPVNPAPTVALSASPTSVTAGQASTLTWTSTNATSCAASGAWSGSEPLSGSVSTGAVNQNSTYSLTCTGSGGSATASASVTVSAPKPTASLSASPSTISSGQSSTLSWNSTNATSCTASGAWSGSLATSGTKAVAPTSTATYSLTCTGSGGSATTSTVVTVGSSPSALLFGDDFNGAAGSLPSSTLWGAKTGGSNGSVAWNGWNNVSEDGQGNLVITARKNSSGQWTSSFISGKIGYSGQRHIEARAKVACGAGTWSAPVWEWGYPYGGTPSLEDDVNEQLGDQAQSYHATLHNWNGGTNPQSGKTLSTGQTLCNDFHVYAANVYADHVDFFIDGNKDGTILGSAIGLSDLTTWKVVADIDLNMGGWGGTIGVTGPVSMLVDYIHVSKL